MLCATIVLGVEKSASNGAMERYSARNAQRYDCE